MKFLDLAGLKTALARVRKYTEKSIAALTDVYAFKSHSHVISDITNLSEATTVSTGLMAAQDKLKLDGIAEGAQVNVIEAINVNGNALTPVSKAVNVVVPTKVSDISNDKDYQTAEQVATAIRKAVSSVYKPLGNIEPSLLTSDLLVEENLGNCYNVTEDFTTTAYFVEGAGVSVGAGTDVSIVKSGDGYKFNALSTKSDLSYLETEALTTEEIEAACTEILGAAA